MVYDTYFFVSALKYFRMTSFERKTAMAPAMKNAGIMLFHVWAVR